MSEVGRRISEVGRRISEDRAHQDAVACHFDSSKGPKLIRLHFVRDEVIAA
ncbi:MAG: hypothetical protein KGY41_08075 [Desulfovermiculus sp.]|nr:hypothetical protein [Desulfovermiculus sp.]